MQAVTLERFGGLDLRSDPGEVGFNGAIDGLNFDLERQGRTATRAGHASFATPAAGTAGMLTALGALLYLARGTSIDKIDASGTVTNLGTLASAPIARPVAIGTPTTDVVFFPNPVSTLQKSTGGGALAASVGKPGLVAVHPVDNRLVQANYAAAADSPTGANGSASTVFFSDPGAPETYGANSYLHLHPGDGEQIIGLQTWRELLFVFKNSHIFVFYGTSTDGAGGPIFNYRTVTLQNPLLTVSAGPPICAGPDGVYFQAVGGIYRTTGDAPVLVSSPVGPIFDGTADSSFAAATAAGMPLSWADDRLFAKYTTAASTARYLVWNSQTDSWSVWAWPYTTVPAQFTPPGFALPAPWMAAVSGSVVKASVTATADNGTAMVASYQTGYSDLGNAGQKRVRELILQGSGVPLVGVGGDYGTPDTATAVTLGTAPAIGEGRDRRSRKARNFSLKLSSTSGAWSVNRASLMVAETRDAALR